ncbi:MAG: addiction module toxin RelE [Bradyrhizobium sp.]|nr:addiction module toxin RelE [Bradyrhizobium sp.]
MTRIFRNGWFQRFARKEKLSDDALVEAIARAEQGLIDADLGDGLIKRRVARQGEEKPGGYRTLFFFRAGDRAIVAFGFAEARQANISKADLVLLKQAAEVALGWSDEELDRLVASGALMEIDRDEED